MHKRIDYIFARLDNTALYFFGQVVGGQERHVGGNDHMQIHVQIAAHVTRAEPVNANHVRAGECDFAQLLGHLGARAFVGHAVNARPCNFKARVQNENGNDNRAHGVCKPECGTKNPEQDRNQDRYGTVGVAPMVPSVCFDGLAADGATFRPGVAEKYLFHDD